MNKTIKGLIMILLLNITTFGFFGCKHESGAAAKSTKESVTKNSFDQISAVEAKELMDTETDYVIIDARSDSEFNQGHIENAVLIPEYEVAERAEKEITDKDKLILVYCRSGRRSKIACRALADLGYTKVKDFGGIIDWPYETVK